MVDPMQEEPNPLMRKKKTPEELAREAEAEDEDEFTSECVGRISKLKKRCIILQFARETHAENTNCTEIYNFRKTHQFN